MKKLLRAIHDAWYEMLDHLGRGDYLTLDCREGQHGACDTCSCECHLHFT